MRWNFRFTTAGASSLRGEDHRRTSTDFFSVVDPLLQPLPTTARELTSAFRAAGTLEQGDIVAAEITSQVQTAVSHLRFVEVEYATGSRPALRGRILLKWPIDDSPAPDRGGAETAFYRELAPSLPRPPLVRCLATAPPTSDLQWLVLEDVRSTHWQAPWPVCPPDHEIRQAIIVLARLHSQWWDPSGRIRFGKPNTENDLRAMIEGIKAHLPAFLLDSGDDLPKSDRLVLEAVFTSSLAPWLRLLEPRDLTIIHGDAHIWNFLFDRDGTGLPYLIDWQTWHQDVGARDLAFLMALHWDSQTRARLERPLLELYHHELLRSGIDTYSFDDLLLDYRRCVVRNLTFPIIFWSRGFPRERWRYRLDCSLAAFRELEGAELL